MQPDALNQQLIVSVLHRDTPQALALLHAGADPNAYYTMPSAPKDNSPTAFLLACSATWNAAWQSGLMEGFVYREGQPDEDPHLVQIMLEKGAKNIQSGFFCAVRQGGIATAELLLQQGANVNLYDNTGMTALMQATMNVDEAMVRLLLAQGADSNAQDKNGETAMHYGCIGYVNDVVRLLLAQGANPNLPGQDGKTVRDYLRRDKRSNTRKRIRSHILAR